MWQHVTDTHFRVHEGQRCPPGSLTLSLPPGRCMTSLTVFFLFVYVTSYDFLNKSLFCVHPSWGANAVIALDIFPTGVTSIRWRKRFTETGQTIIVTGQIHGCLCYLTHTHARTRPPPPHIHTHTHPRRKTIVYITWLCVCMHVCMHVCACMHACVCVFFLCW